MMKNKFGKLNLILAATAVAATALGGAMFNNTQASAADPVKYNVKDVFATSNANAITSTEIGEGENKQNVATFSLTDEAYAYIKRDRAFKWYKEGTANYLNLAMSFNSLAFKTVTLSPVKY